jgi:hypothetical protein
MVHGAYEYEYEKSEESVSETQSIPICICLSLNCSHPNGLERGQLLFRAIFYPSSPPLYRYRYSLAARGARRSLSQLSTKNCS